MKSTVVKRRAEGEKETERRREERMERETVFQKAEMEKEYFLLT